MFFFNDAPTTQIYTLSLHDALPISSGLAGHRLGPLSQEVITENKRSHRFRSEEHTSELQSHSDLVCRLLLEKKTVRADDGAGVDGDSVANPGLRGDDGVREQTHVVA